MRVLRGLFVLLLLSVWARQTALAADNLAPPDAWQSVPEVKAEAKNGAIAIRTETGAYGELRQALPISPTSPKQIKISFHYTTKADLPENASFAFSWSFTDARGGAIATNSSYYRLPAAPTGRPMLFLTDVPADAAKMLVKFQPQNAESGKFIPSYIKFTDFAVVDGGPSKEARQLLAKPLTQSDKSKRWPDEPLRGLGVIALKPTAGNMQDPGEFISEDTFKKFAAWHVNSLRVEVRCDEGGPWDVKAGEKLPAIPADDPMAPYRKRLDALRITLHLAEKYGMSVIIVCEPVGRKTDAPVPAGDTPNWEKELAKMWGYVAKEVGKHPAVLGYDLLNEPTGKEEEARWRKNTLPELIKQIRAIDKNTYLVVEPAPWGLPWGLDKFEPLDDTKVVYSFHHYMPHSYTHQGISNYKGAAFEGKAYPGLLSRFGDTPPIQWDKGELEKSMQAAIDFKNAHHAIIYVGEFSVVRWAPGSAQWLKDSIELFEKHGMSWSFHGYGSWNGWNPTFDAADPQSSDSDGGKMTDRLQSLLDGWKKNKP